MSKQRWDLNWKKFAVSSVGMLSLLTVIPLKSVANPSEDLSAKKLNSDSPSTIANSTFPLNSSLPTGNSSAMSPVTSVSQLSDVRPTDWAFQALQSLVERYGCIVGYPDKTYRGNRSLSRYEFAAGLNACLDRINELLVSATADLARKEDLELVKKLQEQFAPELAALRGRVEALETRTATLERQQFSPTTQLRGDATFVVADTFGDRANNTPRNDTRDETRIFFAYRARLALQTSFTGRDQLTTGLQATNVPNFSSFTGTQMTRFSFERQGAYADSALFLDRLYYRFPVGQKLTVWVGPRALQPSVFAPTLNPLVGGVTGASSRFSTFNHTLYRPGFDGAGAALGYKFSNQLQFHLGYIVDNTQVSNPDNGRGLFQGNNLTLAQLTFSPTRQFDVAFTYGRKYFGSNTGFNLTGGTGSAFARNPFDQNATVSDNFGLEANWRASARLNIGGWLGYTRAHQVRGADNEATIVHGAIVVAFPDLFVKGNLGGFIIGVPPKVTRNDYRPRLNAARREDLDTSLHLEAFYTFQLTPSISITPNVYVVTQPEHNDANDAIWVGLIRTNFSF